MQRFPAWQAFILAACLLMAPLPAAGAGTNLQQLLQMGADALKAGNSLLATQKYQEAVTQNPNSHQAWYRLAEAQYKSKSYRDAIKSVSKAIQLAPDQPQLAAKYYTGRAWACYQAGLYGQAVIDMERAAELAPNNRQYQNWLNGARQKEQQKGSGPSLSSVLGYEEMQRSSAGGSESSGSGEQDRGYREEEQRQPFGDDSEERASQQSRGSGRSQEESSGGRQYREEREPQGERVYREEREERQETSGRERNQEESRQGERYQEERPARESSGSGEGDSLLSELSTRCRKSYFVCMAGCADIQSSESRGICENACRSAAKACQ